MQSPQFGSLTRESPRHGKAATPLAGAAASEVVASPLGLPTPASSRPQTALANRNFMVDELDGDGGAPADDGFVLGQDSR